MTKKLEARVSIDDFNTVNQHPIGMLDGYELAFEKERLLALLLANCIMKKDLLAAYKTKFDYPELVQDGLLVQTQDGYCLTEKAISLLYGYKKT